MMKSRKNKISALLTALVVFVSLISLSIIYVPKFMGYHAYSIETGSMEPTLPLGCLAYVKNYPSFEDYQVNDIVTFADMSRETFFTHRIVETDAKNQCFITKGDANEDVDPSPTAAINAVGKVQFSIPFLGYVAAFLRYRTVKIAVGIIYIAWIAIEVELIIAERKKRDE